MGKCRMLIDENEELGRQLSQGRVAQLQAELALQKSANEEMQKSMDELAGFVVMLDEEVVDCLNIIIFEFYFTATMNTSKNEKIMCWKLSITILKSSSAR